MTAVHLHTQCPNCRRVLRVPREYVGRGVGCRHCDHTFTVPERFVVGCPRCSRELRVRGEYFGKLAGCKHCDHEFEIVAELQRFEGVVADPVVGSGFGAGAPPSPDARAGELEIEALRAEVSRLASMLGESEARARALELELASASASAAPPCPDAVPADSAPDSASESELALESDRLAGLEAELEALRGERSEREAIAAERDRLRDEVRDLVSNLEALRVENDQLDALRGELEAARREVEGLRGECESLRVSGAPEALASALSEAESLRAELDRLRESSAPVEGGESSIPELEALRAERDDLAARLEALARRLDNHKLHFEQMGRLAAEYDAVCAERDRLRGENRELRRQSRGLWGEVERLDSQAQSAEAEAREHRARLERELASESEVGSGGACGSSEGDATELESLRRRLAAAIQERDRVEGARAEVEARYHQMVARGNAVFQKAQQHLDALTKRNQALAEEVKQLRAEVRRLAELEEARRREAMAAEFGANVAMTTAAVAGPVATPGAASASVDPGMWESGAKIRIPMATPMSLAGASGAVTGAGAGASLAPAEAVADLERRLSRFRRRSDGSEAELGGESDAGADSESGANPEGGTPEVGEELIIIHTDFALNQLLDDEE